MAYRLANAIRQITCDALVDAIDTGGAGTIQIRTGSQPTNVDDAPYPTLLGTLTFNATAFGAASGTGVATAASITPDADADAGGTAAHARILRGNGNIHSDCTCGQGSGDINFNNNVIVINGTISITAMTITVPMV